MLEGRDSVRETGACLLIASSSERDSVSETAVSLLTASSSGRDSVKKTANAASLDASSERDSVRETGACLLIVSARVRDSVRLFEMSLDSWSEIDSDSSANLRLIVIRLQRRRFHLHMVENYLVYHLVG